MDYNPIDIDLLLNGTKRELQTDRFEYKWETDEQSRGWRDVYVFISSTFNDMHAERNYLVKRVFPELTQWCAERRLRLRDIDLRWGITEEDSRDNLRTVQICLENVDRCRPFFVCLVGQRRGWVPSDRDIPEKTFDEFPGLRERLGSSVTEMEVIHSLIDPMRRTELPEEDKLERAFFYLRDPSYLEDIKSKELLDIYTNSACADPAREDELLSKFRDEILPETGRPCRFYGGRWDPDARTPELAAIPGTPPEIVEGQLTDFTCEGRSLADVILGDLKAAIAERYEVPSAGEPGSQLDRELEAQAMFLEACEEGYIEREGDLEPLDDYILYGGDGPLIVTGGAGTGKSSLLAHWIVNSEYRVFYRFIGRSLDSGTAPQVAHSLWQELFEEDKVTDPPPEDTAALLEDFGEMLGKAAEDFNLILVLDAVDQWPAGAADARFLPQQLPEGVRMILSIREDSPGAERYLREAGSYARIIRVKPFAGIDDRTALVNAYLSNYLKQLGASAQQALVTSPGAENPLYLKIVLNELRVYGAHSTLQVHIENDFGGTPIQAFDALLARLESDQDISRIPMKVLVPHVFGWLAHARYGLSAEELGRLLTAAGLIEDPAEAGDAVRMLFRQLRPFLAERGQRTDFFYDSFRRACADRYTADRDAAVWHGELADCFALSEQTDPHRLSELAFQYVRAGRTGEYLDTVFDFSYVSERLRIHGLQALADDYRLYAADETVRMANFLGLAGPVLAAEPDQLLPRLYGHLGGCPLPAVQKLLREGAEECGTRWLKPLIPCFAPPRGSTELVMEARKDMSANAVLLRDDTLAAVILDRKTILVWDLASGQASLRIPAEEDGRFIALRGTPDGRRLIAAADCPSSPDGEDGGRWILVYETDGFTCENRFRIGSRDISYRHYKLYYMRDNRFEVTPDGSGIVTMDEAGIFRIYDLRTGEAVSETGYSPVANTWAVSPAGLIAVGNIHPQNGDDRYDEPNFIRKANPVRLLRCDMERKTFVPAGSQADGETGGAGDGPFQAELGGMTSTVEAVALSTDGRMLAASDLFWTGVWDTVTGSLIAYLDLPRVRELAFLSGDRLLTAGRTIRICDLSDRDNPRVIREITGIGYCNGISMSADESFAAARIGDRKLRILSLEEDAGTADADAFAPVPVRSVSLSPDGAYVCGSGYPNFISRGYERTAGENSEPHLFVYDRGTGALAGQMRLTALENRDFVYLAPDGTMAVSMRFQEQGKVTWRHWELPEDLPKQMEDPDGEIGRGEKRLLGNSSSRQFNVRYSTDFAENYQFSADRRFLVIKLGPESTAEVCGADGRNGSVGRIRFELPANGLMKLFRAKPKFDDPAMADPLFDVTDGGRTLVALFNNAERPRVERYALPSGKCLSSKPLAEGTISSYGSTQNALCRVVSGGELLAVVTAGAAAVIDIATGRRCFYLDKEAAECEADDYFGACSADGKILAISGKKDYQDANWRVQLWDVEKAERIGSFTADGSVGEMRFEEDERTLVFGMGNGRICRLAVSEGGAADTRHDRA